MQIRAVLARIAAGESLDCAQMQSVMHQMLDGQLTAAQMGALLMGLRMKGESLDELVGAALVMRELAEPVHFADGQVLDTCGTGGDGLNIFNVSTASAFVVAAAGGKVAKHGNRAVSGNCGSADVLEAAGVYLPLAPDQVVRCVDSLGVGFMFAPAYHQAMRHVGAVRRELGIRTLFNILGPLANPAGVRHQVVGVFARGLCRPLAEVLARLGSRHVLVVHAEDGLDEISLAAPTHVAELRDGCVVEYSVRPEDFGIESCSLDSLVVADARASLAVIRDALGKRRTEAGRRAADIIMLNSGAALYAADLASHLQQGVKMAQDALYSGLALEKLDELVAFTSVFRQETPA